ncbi:ABC transporter ATP-binding protein [Geobacter sp. AOG1]|uniref:ABC transporter ATP-binding protein n=1 Tax=Geobacter sp. AOG1 TaxID=1566346 RepID=UPI001CC677D7|nr:ABC transporter ATP-binding protein [Geobacter sp. AOG1]GFE58474.1 hypothetical protein AOG1_23540 [Geobacter sp. AOG1]
MSEVLVSVDNVSKKFCRSLKKSLWYGMLDLGSELLGRRHGGNGELRSDEFWAVKDVSFELKRGECLGLIGLNGAGKSTLLRILNGLIKPDQGRVEMRGRVGAMISLGAGFNPILTGRENIYINASVLGLTKKEIDERIDEIIDFSELGDFIDAPVQNYSSGMNIRLGFAVATALDPDILLLDEVLAVGDFSFRFKSYRRIHNLISNCAVILVSHSMNDIAAVCTNAIVMKGGEGEKFQNVTEAINAYYKLNLPDTTEEDAVGRIFQIHPPLISAEVVICNPKVDYRGRLDVEIHLETSEPLQDVVVSFDCRNSLNVQCLNWNSMNSDNVINIPKGKSRFCFSIHPLLLNADRYYWSLWLAHRATIGPLIYSNRAGSFEVQSKYFSNSHIPYLADSTKYELITEEA